MMKRSADDLETIRLCVANFAIDTVAYRLRETPNQRTRRDNNAVYLKDADRQDGLSVTFMKGVSDSIVYIGANVKGSISIQVRGSGSVIYIGDKCNLNALKIRSFQEDDVVVIGNNVTTTGEVSLVSGNGSGNARPMMVIGDDCMFSYGITIRNSDAHPIVSVNDGRQLNEPAASVIIEPHVWIAQDASILKNVSIGACSIVALGSVVTTSCPRFSVLSGVPAVARPCNSGLWSRSLAAHHVGKAMMYYEKLVTGTSGSAGAGEPQVPDSNGR